jgi:soluble lytic murein transglycosylase
MTGKILAEKGDPEAGGHLQRAAEIPTPIRDYIQEARCRFLEGKGDPMEISGCYELMSRENPESRLREKASFQSARYLKESGDGKRSEKAFLAFLKHFPRSDYLPDVLFHLSELSLKRGETRRAVSYLKRIWIEFPLSLHADYAGDRIFESRRQGIDGARITFGDFLKRARQFYREKSYTRAAGTYEEILSDSRISDGQRQEARFYLAMSYYSLRSWEKSARAFEKYLRDYPEGEKKHDSLFWLGKVYFRQEKSGDHLRVHQRFLDLYPESGKRGEVLWILVVHYKDEGDTGKAVRILRQLRKESPQGEWRARSLWEEGWLAYQAGNDAEAVAVWEELESAPRDYRAQALYWKGRSFERMGEVNQSLENFRNLCDQFPYSYYCQAVLQRSIGDQAGGVGRFVGMERSPISGDISAEIRNHPKYPRIFALSLVGLTSEAYREARSLQREIRRNREKALSMAKFLYQLGDTPQTIGIIHDHFSAALMEGDPALPVDFWELAYPRVYAPIIQSYADRHGLDPALIAALIREESWYNPEAVSPAGALGLMQVMPSTADVLAKGYLFSDDSSTHSIKESLVDPEWNIILGTRFLADLMEEFGNETGLVVAAYNAGPGAVRKWLRRYGSVPMDEFIEMIPYSETRRYVKRVLRSYAEYRRIYFLTGDRQRQYSLLSPTNLQ